MENVPRGRQQLPRSRDLRDFSPSRLTNQKPRLRSEKIRNNQILPKDFPVNHEARCASGLNCELLDLLVDMTQRTSLASPNENFNAWACSRSYGDRRSSIRFSVGSSITAARSGNSSHSRPDANSALQLHGGSGRWRSQRSTADGQVRQSLRNHAERRLSTLLPVRQRMENFRTAI
jgi:hypothetical protein